VRVLEPGDDRTVLEIELREGRKRQIRRMLALFGHDVRRLKRTRFGPLELGDLPVGAWRALDADEERGLREAVAGKGGEAEGRTK
jgi:23S rRNA pseudouridine2605 synthase